ncbi:MAG: hypothetical protein K2I70_01275, partial [Bacilli bacterium]|nr:hypothetical protein [Bacilli bacterium]
SIYEEYTFDLDDEPQEFIVKGFILEERDKGVIITNNERTYAYQDNKEKLIKIDEKRIAYSYKIINEAYKDIGINIQECPIEEKHTWLKQLCLGLPVEADARICKTSINISIPRYDKYAHWQDNQHYHVNINNMPKEHFYKSITGEKILERIDDLLHGNINSQSLVDLKTLLSTRDIYNGETLKNGFNLLNEVKSTSKDVTYDTLASLEEEKLGSSKITLKRSYYEYLREIILDAFQLELPEEIKKLEDVIQLLKSNNSK